MSRPLNATEQALTHRVMPLLNPDDFDDDAWFRVAIVWMVTPPGRKLNFDADVPDELIHRVCRHLGETGLIDKQTGELTATGRNVARAVRAIQSVKHREMAHNRMQRR